jgi:hypothetical protein
MVKLLNDTLKVNGKWSIKRLAGISGFYFAVVYAFIPIFLPMFVVHEFVFWGFITFGASAIGMTVWNKKIDKKDPEQE